MTIPQPSTLAIASRLGERSSISHCTWFIATALVLLLATQPSLAQKKANSWQVESFAKFVNIPGATRVGSDTCQTCHDDISSNFRHAFHAQQGIECEDCHGAGSQHVESGGDITKIVSYLKRSPREANGACLSCHASDHSVRNWMAGPHASNSIRCIDCHQVHGAALAAANQGRLNFESETSGAFMATSLAPETNVIMRTPSATNEACLKCHETERAQMSMPYHHPLREGKMSCVDCHDPHGGPAGNNLRTSTINQLCLTCHAQYRGPFAYQHPPVSENCLLCHSPHGSANTNLLSVSMPALCLQCHAGHHNGAALPLADRCVNCHGSIHGTDTPTPSGGARFVDKGPTERDLINASHASIAALLSGRAAVGAAPLASSAAPLASGPASAPIGTLGTLAEYLTPMAGGDTPDSGNTPAEGAQNSYAAYSITPATYRFIDGSGFLGRVGEYDSLEQSAGFNGETSYVSPPNHLTVVSRANVLSGDDYQAATQLTAGPWINFKLDMRSFMQQQDNYPFYAFPVLDVPVGSTSSPDTTSNFIPTGTLFALKRRLGQASGRGKVPKVPVHWFLNGNWEARVGVEQLAYLDENATPAVFVNGVNTTCGAQCHHVSQFQPVNYTTRGISGGADVDLGPVQLTWEHSFSSFNDRLVFPTPTFTGPFTPEVEGISVVNPPPAGPAPRDIAAGNYAIDIPSPSQASTDRVSMNWNASPSLTFNGNISYSRLRDLLTDYPQNSLNSDETLTWRPVSRLRVTADYHQQNQLNDFIPYYSLYGNVSYHEHSEGLRADYELPRNFDAEAYYRRDGTTRSNADLWPQIYSIDNTDLLLVVPSSFSNTVGTALRYHQRGLWSARAGYEWTGTHQPGYLIVPKSNNRIFADATFTPNSRVVFANDLSIIVQNAFAAIPLPNLPGDFQRRNRFYYETASGTFRPMPTWNLGLGYSYQQNNLTTYMAFQNDNSVGYVVNEPAVPFRQIDQAYWGDSSYTIKHFGVDLRITYNSSTSQMRPDVNPADAALLGNQSLIAAGAFDPTMLAAALGNVQFSATQISAVAVPQWIGQSKAFYTFPHKFEGGLVFNYGSYRDFWNPNLNGVLRTFNVYVGRSW